MVKFSKIDDNEFSRVLSAPRLAQLPMTVEISADRRECAALALRFDLMDIASLTAKLTSQTAVPPCVDRKSISVVMLPIRITLLNAAIWHLHFILLRKTVT